MKTYDHVVSFALEHPWAITRPMLRTIASIIGRHAAGVELPAAEIQAAVKSKRELPQPKTGTVGVLPVYGVITPRASLFTEMSGVMSVEQLSEQLAAFVADDAISTIVLDVDSPGGNVAGVTEFAREILKAREQKPIVAVAHFTMASAAYWLSSAATEIVASESARVGAIGVYTMHEDLSKAFEREGVKRTYISAGKHKIDANETEPLSEEAHAAIKAAVDEVYGQMVGDIAKGRGVGVADVRNGFGEGRVLSAQQALAAGLIDRVATFGSVIGSLVGRRGSVAVSRTRAEAEPAPIVADVPVPAEEIPIDVDAAIAKPTADDLAVAAEHEAIGVALTK